MPNPLPDDVRNAIGAGEKIEAIRLLRQHTGLGLAEAKAAVEAGMMPAAPEGAQHAEAFPPGPFPPEVHAALAAGDKIGAIRLLRVARGVGLKDAKDMIDAAPSGPALQSPQGVPGLAPGEVPRSGFGAGLVILLVVLAAVAAWFLVRPT